jgi:hypothetical protein
MALPVHQGDVHGFHYTRFLRYFFVFRELGASSVVGCSLAFQASQVRPRPSEGAEYQLSWTLP